MNILLGVSGSISAYKTLDLCRLWIKNGHRVKVILTKGAEKFVVKEVYQYLGAEDVFSSDDDFKTSQQQITHIQLAKWCDRFVLAPLSANTLAQLAIAAAGDLLTSVFLLLEKKIKILYPAMNPTMYHHSLVQKNLTTLKGLNHCLVIEPDVGQMACGDFGIGKLPQIEDIAIQATTFNPDTQNKKNILISTGATLAPLDPIRYLTNPSSGKTGLQLAKKYLLEGHQVQVVAGQKSTKQLDALTALPNFQLFRVTTTEEMNEKVLLLFPNSDLYISSAAMCDIKFNQSDEKIKKKNMKKELPIAFSPDVLANVLKIKKPSQKIIGFAAETNLEENLSEKNKRKPVDLLIGNSVNNGLTKSDSKQKGFANDHGDYLLLQAGKTHLLGNISKQQLANEIYERSSRW